MREWDREFSDQRIVVELRWARSCTIPFGPSRASASKKLKGKTKMKSLITRMIGLAQGGTLTVCLSIVMVAITPPVALANSGTWSLDPATSSARLFQGSRANPDSVNTGVARVTGKVKLDPNDPENSVVDLNIFPGEEDWEHALSPEGDLPTGYVPDATDHTLLTFKSNRILKAPDGRLQVKGDLTVTRVERRPD
jgi:polyisoprenoid-binding protein YceI